uniref:DZIP3-like HEPN domain-containing protein n=1 Tax=Magallana gigas TaxID=29159 RepID=A0A8W8J3T1_MAGGI
MASNDLSKAEQNFTCFTKACIDFIKLPLIDLLTNCVKPVDLYVKIKCSSTLMYGKNKLRPDQLKLCFFPLPLLPDYSKFDVTLLYTLIRNLCPSLTPTQGWGLEPNNTDTKIGDDIERLRLFRNNFYAHADSTEISDSDFNNLWKDMQSVIQRIETFTKTWSTTNYKQELTRIKGCRFGYDDRDHYRLLLEATLFASKSEEIDEPDILIKGEDRVVCGDSARFDAEVKRAQLSEWSITWQKKTDDITIKINTSDKKYKGSSRRQLVIQSLCKDDEAEYQAILSNGSKLNIISNIIYLQALGERPVFDVWDIVTDIDAITIQYRYKVPEHSPQVYQEEWTKNREAIERTNFKYLGGQLYSNYFTIKSPTLDDKGTYSCTVTNAVGSASKDVTFDVPFAQISTDSKGVFGSMTIFKSEITSCPKLERVEWQGSSDGKKFFRIDISKPHYHGSKQLAESPSLVISKTNFEDRLHYQLCVRNKIGRTFSNILYLDVKGSPPNITTSHETYFEKHSVKLVGNVFLYNECNATTDVFWTKNGNKIDTLNNGGKYSKASTDDSSFTISDVNEHDAGSYQLTATNDVGSTQSDVIVLAIPQVCVKRLENRDGCLVFTALIQSIPAAYHAQWKVKGKDDNTFKPIDVNAKEYKGTSNSLPHPVLVVEQKEEIQKQHFYIQVDNFVGSSKIEISKNAEILSETALKTEGDNSSNIFNKNGSTIRFNELRRQIIKGLKQSDLQELKDSLEVISERKICDDIASISDFFRYILGKAFLKTRNVIILQYLMRAINRPDLEEMCVKYATKDNQALCYYEDPKGQDVPKVYLHVVDDIEHFTSIEPLKQTVASIVGCTLDDIKVIGFQPENSFIIIITMRLELLKTLKEAQIQNLTKLLNFNIDWIQIEDKVIKIGAGE